MLHRVEIIPVEGIPAIFPGDPLAERIFEAAQAMGLEFQSGDILVVCQKVVSKAEGRVVPLAGVSPSPFASRLAASCGKDPRLVELILRESTRLIKTAQGHLICETGPGWVCANAGVDESNSVAEQVAVLLPEDPDRSAGMLSEALSALSGVPLAVIIGDTFGRPWREGLVDVALGAAGIGSLMDYQGRTDLIGRPLKHTVVAVADQLAAAAGLVMEKDRGIPAAVIRGYQGRGGRGCGADLVRPAHSDLFR